MERNEPCYCGSGKKYKKCCLAKDEAEAAMRKAEEQRRADAEAAEQRRTRGSAPGLHPGDDDTAAPHKPVPSALPEEDQKLVDAWWAEVSPVYMSRSGLDRAEWLLGRTVAFLDEQPRLFRHLEVHDEFLLELGPALNRAGLMASHHALLLRLRREQPEVYALRFGYWDLDLLVEALRTGCREDIPACLAHFQRNPVRFVDELAHVVDLLAWQGCESELHDLLKSTAAIVVDSPEVIDGGFGMRWLVNLAMFPTLERGDTSADSLAELCERVMAVGYLRDDADNREWLRHGALMAMPTELEAGLNLDQVHSVSFDGDVAWSFTGWLRRTKGLAWSSARFLAESLIAYWGWLDDANKDAARAGGKGSKAAGKVKSRGTFGLDGDCLREFLNDYCWNIFGIRAITAVPALQAYHYFTEYLVARGRLDDTRAAQFQEFSARNFEVIRKHVGADSPPYRLYPTYAELIGGRDGSTGGGRE
jgi:hypothetical protein